MSSTCRGSRIFCARVRSRAIRVHEVETARASPFARSLVFAYVAAYLYEQDAPLAERRAQALTLDRGLLAELLGQAELRDLIDPGVLAELEAELQHLAPGRQARDADGVHDLLRRLGDLTVAEVAGRCAGRDGRAGARPTARPTGRAGGWAGSTPWTSSAAPLWSAWPGRTAGSPRRTPGFTAMPSGWSRRQGCPKPVWP